MRAWSALVDRFPRLAAATRRHARLSVVLQRHPADCGAACLAMVAQWLGAAVALEDVLALGAGTRLGWTAADFARVAARLGLKSRALRVEEIDELAALDRPVVLHWRFNHYVVLRALSRDGARILDPAVGELEVTRRELEAAFTGVVIWTELAGAPLGAPVRARGPSGWTLVRALVLNAPQAPRLLLAATALQMLALAPALFASVALGGVAVGGDRGVVAVLAVAACTIGAVQWLLALLKNHLAVVFRNQIGVQLKAELVDRLLGARWAALVERSGSDWLARLAAADALRDAICGLGLALVLDLLLALGAGAMLLVLHAPAALLALALSGAAALVLAMRHGRRERLMRRAFLATAAADGFQVQLTAGLETLRAGGMGEWAADRWSELCVRRANADAELGALEAGLNANGQLLLFAGPMALATLLASGILSGAIALGAGLIAYTLGIGLFAALLRVLDALLALHKAVFSAERVGELLALEQVSPAGQGVPLHAAPAVAIAGLTYRHATNAAPALDDVALEIGAGQLVLVVGPSGCGKSTLLGALAGLFEPEAGTISIGRVPLARVDRARSSRPIVAVPQFPYLFAGSIRENIALGRVDAGLDAIEAAARLALIDEEIRALPMGYETLLAEGGAGLSGGQRQRIALARALLLEPGVLILDEATSALDPACEAALLENLAGLDCTRVLATHRLQLAHLADRVVVLEHGRVVEHGHATELDRTGTRFHRLRGVAATTVLEHSCAS